MQSVRRSVTPHRVVAIRGGRRTERPDVLATEEPMEIRAHGPGQEPAPVAVTLRTPGHDFELAVGFLHGEGLLTAGDVTTVSYCERIERQDQAYNVVTVGLARPFVPPPPRAFAATAACGVCGKTSLDEVSVRCGPVSAGPVMSAETLVTLPDRLRADQVLFGRTGGLHGAGVFDAEGDPLCIREDIGRHNAVDKTVGWALLADRNSPAPVLAGAVLVVSGRLGFEIVQKAAMAGIGLIGAVSAPSSLAVATADRLGVTLAAFIRGDSMNVYTHPHRIM